MAQNRLGPFEADVLTVLLGRPTEPYGVRIQELLKQATGRAPSVGGLYTTLDRLERKGLVSSWWGEPTAERGGRRKRYFRIEAKGVVALASTASMPAPFGFLPPQVA